MPTTADTSYDTIPYEGRAFSDTHPDQLATVAALMGVEAPSPDRCRVLEIGCGDGGNLIPMAESLPQSRFFGFDLGKKHIKRGNLFIEALGLENIELRHLDIAEFCDEFGQFDYIICHGVYSWVPPETQKQILEICSRHLSQTGVAYVSHNILPGWHTRRMVRDMTAYHGSDQLDAQTRLQSARAFVDEVGEGLTLFESPYGTLLEQEFQRAREAEDHYFFHEYLEEYNEPLYLHQFLERTESHGLQFLADSEIRLCLPGFGAPDIESFLQSLSTDRVGRQQYVDFVSNRAFRRTLLCHAAVPVASEVTPDVLSNFYVSTESVMAEPESNPTASIVARDGTQLTLRLPLVAAAFRHLTLIQPEYLGVDDLLPAARRLMGLSEGSSTEEADREILQQWLLVGQAIAPTAVIDLHRFPNRFVSGVSERPLASPVVRWQSKNGASAVTNRQHQHKPLDELHRQFLGLLDGTLTREDLMSVAHEARKDGIMPAPCESLGDAEVIDLVLGNCARAGLLIA